MSASWKGRICLVTGGFGFGGSHLCEQLLNRESTVFVLDRIKPADSYLVIKGLDKDVEYIPGDIRDTELVKLAMERREIDTVFHLAAQPIVPVSNAHPLETLAVNAMGTYSVLEAIRTSAFVKRMVFASSGAYYGTTTQREPIPEEQAPRVAGNIYAPSKVAGDIAVRCYAQVFGLRMAVCRFINTYGPGSTNFSTIVPKAMKLLMRNEPYDFGSRDDGTTTLDFLNVRDMANGYIAMAENIEKVNGQAVNFGGESCLNIRDLVMLISRLYDGREREPVFRGNMRDIPLCKRLDTTRARNLLGWRPTTTLEAGLMETVQWYKENWPRLRA